MNWKAPRRLKVTLELGLLCDACGDPATHTWRGRELCRECWLELAKGVISTQPAKLYSGGHCSGADVDGPVRRQQWQENAIRQMEDG